MYIKRLVLLSRSHLVHLSAVKSISSCEKRQLKNYDINIFPARLSQTFSGFGSSKIRFGFGSNVFRLNFCGFGLAPRSTVDEVVTLALKRSMVELHPWLINASDIITSLSC